jgi:hypothetical protein
MRSLRDILARPIPLSVVDVGAASMGEGTDAYAALVVHTEVEFVPIDRDQPLFGDVDVFLRAEGFMLHRFEGLFSRQLVPMVLGGDPFAAGTRFLQAYLDGLNAVPLSPTARRAGRAARNAP